MLPAYPITSSVKMLAPLARLLLAREAWDAALSNLGADLRGKGAFGSTTGTPGTW